MSDPFHTNQSGPALPAQRADWHLIDGDVDGDVYHHRRTNITLSRIASHRTSNESLTEQRLMSRRCEVFMRAAETGHLKQRYQPHMDISRHCADPCCFCLLSTKAE